MQSLLVRFEPPDVYGVPANKEAVEVMHPEDSRENSVSELLLDISNVPVHTKPASLPTDMSANTQVASQTTFQSLPLLNKLGK